LIIPLGHPDGDTQSARENKQVVREDPDASAKHILIIDNAEASRSLISQALCEAGYRVTAVEDPTQALSTVEALQEVIQQVGRVLNEELAE